MYLSIFLFFLVIKFYGCIWLVTAKKVFQCIKIFSNITVGIGLISNIIIKFFIIFFNNSILKYNIIKNSVFNHNYYSNRLFLPGYLFISSPLEQLDQSSPLENIISSLVILNWCIFLLYLISIYMILNRLFIYYNMDIIFNFLKPYLSDKFINYFINKNNKYKSINDTIFYITIIIINIIIIFFIFMNIYITSELLVHFDQYINVYNTFFKK